MARVSGPRSWRKPLIALALTQALFAGTAGAVELGKLTKQEANARGVLLHTDSKAVVQIDLLRADLFRVWAGPEGKLVDADNKAAPIVLKTDYPKVEFTLTDAGDHQLLRTARLALRIYKQPLKLALYKADNQTLIWQELKPIDLDEKGSYQTLSSQESERFFGGGQQNGQFEFKGKTLEISYSGGWEEGDRPSPAPFYMTNKGYGVLRNTWANGSYDFRSSDYISTRHAEHRFDAYYLVGDTLAEILAGYTELTGRAPLLPRWAFEYGDADCYNDGDNVKKPGTVPDGWSDGPTGHTPDVIASVAKKYREHDMPGGWILPNDGYGCGYTQLPDVVKGLQDLGFRTGLWTENGVDKIAWEVGTAGSRAQKLDVAWTGQGYQFALDANKAAADGILNNSDSRPFIWTVMGWAGIQRYAVTWTGDQSGSWDYIRWHIPTLIGSGLSGQVYATGDVDGIFGGSPETYTRDLQWKAFTPVLMGMSGWSQGVRKHPWWYEEPYRSINRDYLKLKMRLMPYMYTLAWQAEQSGAPIVRGLMWDYPQDPHAFTETYKNQFLLGKDFLVAPVYRSQSGSKGWRENIHLPQGTWIDYWDGRVTEAGEKGREIDYPVTLEKLPVLVRAGAIIPMYPVALYDGQVAKDVLTLDIYPHGESTYTLYEDDGNTRQYRGGAFSTQVFTVSAPVKRAGDIRVRIGAVQGNYAGQEEQRVYQLQLHTRVQPQSVSFDGRKLTALADAAAFAKAKSGWYFDAADKYGTVHVKSEKLSVRKAYDVQLQISSTATLAATPDWPVMPVRGNALTADEILVLNRPAEENGQALERAFDGDPSTWFRTKRDQSLKTGPHEFVLALGERRLIEGFEIAPRNDKHWKHGQVRDFEVYLSDRNGDWGKPVHTGRLAQQETAQKVLFPAKAGSLLRFRVLSTHDQTDEQGNDPMVLAANGNERSTAAFNAFLPSVVTPITLSEFRVLEAVVPDKPKQQAYLSDAQWTQVATGKAVQRDAAHKGGAMKMNDLQFRKGLGVPAGSRIDYTLTGHWQLFRADLGIDDSCRAQGGLHFQIWGDDRLLYDSGLVQAPAVVKPELDIRGLRSLSLRTVAGKDSKAGVCGNWANAAVIGIEGDTIGQ